MVRPSLLSGILTFGILGAGLPALGFAHVVDPSLNISSFTNSTETVRLRADAPESEPGRFKVQGVDLVFDPPDPDLCGGGPVSLIGSFSIPSDLADVVEMVAILDLQTDSASLPAFWQFGHGECNDGNLVVNVDGTPWSCGSLIYTSYFSGVPNRARIVVSAFPTTPVSLTAGTTYQAFSLDFVLPSVCEGCAVPTAVVLNEIDLTPGACNGDCPFCDLLSVDEAVPAQTGLRNSPNPFRSSTSVQFDLPVATRVRLNVFDLSGRIVKQLYEGLLPAGAHSVNWDGTDRTGRQVEEGVYFYRLITSGHSETKWMVLIR